MSIIHSFLKLGFYQLKLETFIICSWIKLEDLFKEIKLILLNLIIYVKVKAFIFHEIPKKLLKIVIQKAKDGLFKNIWHHRI